MGRAQNAARNGERHRETCCLLRRCHVLLFMSPTRLTLRMLLFERR
jgi:hypothetical protein